MTADNSHAIIKIPLAAYRRATPTATYRDALRHALAAGWRIRIAPMASSALSDRAVTLDKAEAVADTAPDLVYLTNKSEPDEARTAGLNAIIRIPLIAYMRSRPLPFLTTRAALIDARAWGWRFRAYASAAGALDHALDFGAAVEAARRDPDLVYLTNLEAP